MATYDKEKLLNQIKIADIIFINGGMKGHLMETLKGLGNFPELIIGKVVVGISAGANILTKYYYSSVSKGVREGMGLLPIKLLTHYTDQDDDKLKLLMDYKEKLPLLKIAEEDYLILEIPTWQL
jgi:peptidase E